MPIYTIASNAGVEGAIVIGKLLQQDNHELGYDAAKGVCLLATIFRMIRKVSFCLVYSKSFCSDCLFSFLHIYVQVNM